MLVIPGNHDGGDRVRGDGAAVLARHGIELDHGARVLDVPGLRVVAASSREIGKHRGNLTPLLPEITEALSTAPGERCSRRTIRPFARSSPRSGRPESWASTGGVCCGVSAAHPDTLITAGHTHRNRRRAYRRVPITEVGSPKDYPGVWAGYVVHEGGIRQVVRRIADPQALAWTERTSGALMGWWRYWSRGSLDARCFSHTWRHWTRSVDLVE